MKKFKYILLLLLFLVVAASIYIATLENTYDVKRSIKIKAPVSVVYKQVNDFKNWPSWSPWLQQDPETALSYGDRTSGDGATYSWKSGIIGEGKMETITAIPDDSISQKMELMKPWNSKSDVYWVFRPVNDSTEVTWGMKGSMGFLDRAFIALRGGMDKMVGPDYEKGLVKLDSVVQADMARYSIRVDGITRHGGGYYLYNTASCKIDELSEKMQEMMPVVTDYVQKNNIPMAGAPYALYLKYDTENNAAIFSCAVPVTDRVITAPDSGVQTGYLNPFSALKVTLKGNYTNLEQAWNTAMKYIADNNLKEAVNDPHLEVYPNGPENTPNPADWVTEIYIPVEENN
ncbi:MAG: SRPBCC family protein [Flavobacteriaceae bacterium]|nr:SRPBCC family protein [Flavobacteriaceae bacterium]